MNWPGPKGTVPTGTGWWEGQVRKIRASAGAKVNPVPEWGGGGGDRENQAVREASETRAGSRLT